MIPVKQSIPLHKFQKWNTEYQLNLTKHLVKKGDFLLKEGQRCDYIYFVVKGFLRVFYLDINGNEITHWFSEAHTLVTSPFSFFKKEKNILFFEATENTELIGISSAQLEIILSKLQAKDNDIPKMYLEFAMVLSRRIMSMHTQTAEERYLALMNEHPLLFQKAKLVHIASYLGITPQTLSRIRKRI